MNRFKFDSEKAIEAIKLILANIDGAADFHKIFKILYFTDMAHVAKYGRPVFGDKYIAMRNGPVPSIIYDSLKDLRRGMCQTPGFVESFDTRNYVVVSKNKSIDVDVFSEAELEELTNSISENKNLSFEILTRKSHGFAYNNATYDNSIPIYAIAEEGGAKKEMINYINHQLEIESIINDSAW